VPGSQAPSIDPGEAGASNTGFVRIAIIGTGISGLTVARALHAEHDIVVYEAGDHVGGHTNTIRVDTDDATWHVDTGFIVLNDRNYPRFEALLDELGIARQPTNMSFSVSAEAEDFEYSSGGVRGLLAQPANLARPRFLRMVADYARFNRAEHRPTLAVVNGTTVTGLARIAADELTSNGYPEPNVVTNDATNQTRPVSTVYYEPGHKADAQGVAACLRIGYEHVAPMDANARALADRADVAVFIGADRAR
jgi:hypothetical protein